MNLLEEIRNSNKKPKELNQYIAKLILQKKPSSKEFTEVLASASDSERGTCIEALEYATQTDPQIAKNYLSDVISSLKDKAPRVKWEAARVIGNIAKSIPKEADKAVEGLLENTKDKGTVVRWSTAFALGEIIKYNEKQRPILLKKISEVLKREENNGVRNVYLKALKVINK